jgi:ABC-type transporter Mla maintaining outer membrane lipid asymmetry permease subunit MlaE
MKRKSKVVERLEKMTPEEMAQRWREMRPRYVKFLAFFIAAAFSLFVANHFQHFSQGVLNVVNVAFQIFCVFTVLFGMLTAMSLFYGRDPRKEAA